MYALTATLAVQALISMAGLAPAVFVGTAAPDIGVDPNRIGAFMAIVYIAACVTAAAAGGPVRRYGAIRMSQVGCVLTAIGLALLTTANPWLAFLAAVVIGLGYGPITPASSHILIRQTPPHRRGLVFSLKQTGVPLGGALAGVVVPPLVLTLGWRMTTLILAVAVLAITVAVEPLRASLDDDADPRARANRGLIDAFALVLRLPPLRRLALASLAFSAMQTCFNAFVVTFLTDQVGIDLVTAGLVLAVAQAAAMGGRVLWGWIGDRLMPPRRVLCLLGLAMAASCVALALVTAGWPVLLLGAVTLVLGATGVAWNGVFLGEVARLAPAGNAGTATGGALAFTFMGAVIEPIVFSGLVDWTGSYRLAYVAAAVAAGIAGIVIGRGR
ncbi:MAG TPA: MFS transporter [Stellaceae bacterium]|nr:MFS transporter [Stellaceae bacterium]